MTIHLGITGTRNGCTPAQLDALGRVMRNIHADHGPEADGHEVAFHHGDCIGVDDEAHTMAEDFGFWTVIHPPIDDKYRAYNVGDFTREPEQYLVRNQAIVNEVSLLIVVPSGAEAENPRSGTWATYRMAVRAGVETVVIQP